MFPKLITIGDFFLPTYGFLVATGFLTALWMVNRLARTTDLDADEVSNLAIWCALSGLVGAKLLLILFDWSYYASNPGELFSLETLRVGGVFHGGLIAALLTAVWYLRLHKMSGYATADVLAPAVAVGHGIGRLGCFSAGCCWGTECHLPWAVTFTNPDAAAITGVELNTPLHPTQLYESFAEFLIFGFLYWRFHRPRKDGVIVGLYLVLYSSVRFMVEFVRHHDQPNPLGGPLSSTQWLALLLLVVGGFLIARQKPKPAA